MQHPDSKNGVLNVHFLIFLYKKCCFSSKNVFVCCVFFIPLHQENQSNGFRLYHV